MSAAVRARLALAAAGAALALRAPSLALSAPPTRPADPPADGFDHITHQGRVESRALAPPPCSRCHQIARAGRLRGAPGHAACFGDCHGPPPRTSGSGRAVELEPARRQVCHACHRPALIARVERGAAGRVPSSFPPYELDRDFALTMSHAAHGEVARGCRACHAVPHEPGRDGKRAFSLVEPSCRRCHGPPEREGPSLNLPPARFSHRVHGSSGPGLVCSTCHAIDARGTPATEVRGHAPCSDTRCHADDFAAAAPVICGVCHVRGDPWRDLHDDPAPVDATEFGVDFSHRSHLAAVPAPLAAPCARCHRPAAGGRFQASPGHAACAGSRCHAPLPTSGTPAASPQPDRGTVARGRPEGASPPLSRCSGCHVLGLAEQHELAQRRRRWSVRQRFTHAPHAGEPPAGERAAACIDCHTRALASERLADMTTPRKQTCARCHDGRAAFKLTGHTCSRCHAAPAAPVRTATGSRSETAPPAPPP